MHMHARNARLRYSRPVIATAYRIVYQQRIWKIENGGGQGLGGRHFTQGGCPTVVIGGTFRRNFSLLEGA